MYHWLPCQTHEPQTLQTSQATSDSQEALEFNIHGLEKLSPSSGYTSILVIVDHLSKQSLFILTHNTITSPQPAPLFVLHVFSKQCPKPHHFQSWYRIHIPLLPVPRNCIGHEA